MNNFDNHDNFNTPSGSGFSDPQANDFYGNYARKRRNKMIAVIASLGGVIIILAIVLIVVLSVKDNDKSSSTGNIGFSNIAAGDGFSSYEDVVDRLVECINSKNVDGIMDLISEETLEYAAMIEGMSVSQGKELLKDAYNNWIGWGYIENQKIRAKITDIKTPPEGVYDQSYAFFKGRVKGITILDLDLINVSNNKKVCSCQLYVGEVDGKWYGTWIPV